MNYGLYLSASGVLTNLYRQDVFANNLSNVKTAGFKSDMASVSQRPAEVIEEGFGGHVSDELLDRLGGGVMAGPQRINFQPSTIEQTGGALDAALELPKTFFAVAQTDNATGEQKVSLTRDGRFSLNDQGYLVTVGGGHRVLGPDDQPIRVSGDGPVRIDASGNLIQDGQPVARLQITAVADTDHLIKLGQNLLGFKGGRDGRVPAGASAIVHPGAIESSGVDPIKALMQVIEATKAVTANGNMIRYHDLVMDRAVNVLGRVA